MVRLQWPFWLVGSALTLLVGVFLFFLFGKKQQIGNLNEGFIFESPAALFSQHNFILRAEKHDFLHVIVDQERCDLALKLRNPSGQTEIVVNETSELHGREFLWFVAPQAGAYTLEVIHGNKEKDYGEYRLEVKALRKASRIDEAHARAFSTRIHAGNMAGVHPADEESVRKAYHEAASLWHELKNSYQEAVTLNLQARNQDELGNWKKASKIWVRAASLFRGGGYGHQAVLIYRDLALCYEKNGRIQDSERICEMALELIEQQGDIELSAQILCAFGRLYFQLGRTQPAFSLYERALALTRSEIDRAAEASVLGEMGSYYSRSGRPETARDHLLPASKICRELGLSEREARLTTEIGWTWYLQHDYQKAIDLFDRAIALAREAKAKGAEAGALDRRGSCLREMGRLEEALTSYRKTLDKIGHDPFRAAHVWVNMGVVYEKGGHFSDAIDACQRALPHFEKSGDLLSATHARFVMARAYRHLNQWDVSLRLITEAVGVLEKIREQMTNPAVARSFFGARHDYLDFYLELMVDLYERGFDDHLHIKAFEILEENRARGLRQRLAERIAQVSVQPELLAAERSLREEINEKEHRRLKMLGDADPRALETLAQEIRGLLIRQERIHTKIVEQRRAAGESIPKVSLNVIQRELLDPDTLLLCYGLGPTRSFLWEITREDCRFHPLPSREVIELQIRNLIQLLAMPEEAEDRLQRENLAESLSQILLEPVHNRKKRLVIVKDGWMHRLPFAVLWDPVTGQPLIANHEIAVLPSASYGVQLRHLSVGGKPASMMAAVFADPVFQKTDKRFRESVRDDEAVSLPPKLEEAIRGLSMKNFQRLPFSRDEGEKILSMVPEGLGHGIFGFDVSRERVMSLDLTKYRMIHFATHGMLHPNHPDLSGMVLSLYNREGFSVDGFLRVHEIKSLDMPVALVTLSGCKTALGEEVRGEGIYGMGRVLMETGAARVLASLWSVDDQATAIFMQRFYHFLLKDRLAPAEALRRTHRSMMEHDRYGAPFYWAGFELQGDWRSFLE